MKAHSIWHFIFFLSLIWSWMLRIVYKLFICTQIWVYNQSIGNWLIPHKSLLCAHLKLAIKTDAFHSLFLLRLYQFAWLNSRMLCTVSFDGTASSCSSVTMKSLNTVHIFFFRWLQRFRFMKFLIRHAAVRCARIGCSIIVKFRRKARFPVNNLIYTFYQYHYLSTTASIFNLL